MSLPSLRTERLVLRPYEPPDAADVQRLAGAREVAETTLRIPHPYPDGAAETWIATHVSNWKQGESLALAITSPEDGLIGTVGLDIDADNRRAELGYWVAVPHWGRGYATEAAAAMIDYGFTALDLNRIEAHYLTKNPASARVMEKLGMTFEGVHRQAVVKWDVPEDVGVYAILASEWRPSD